MKYSIIIPVFNVERYLSETIQSVLSQSFSNIEVILVNDGSIDNSGKICEDFACLDDRVKVIHKSNGGVSSARNLGIKEAKGDYIFFVDGDDMLDEDAIANIDAKLKSSSVKYDIILANYREIKNGLVISQRNKYHYDEKLLEQSSRDDILYYLFGTLNRFNHAVWAHAYRTEFVKQNQLFFDESLTINEDGDWCIKAFLKAKNVTAINRSTYIYRIDNVNSATNSKYNLKKIISIYTVYTRWFDYFLYDYKGDKGKEAMIQYLAAKYTSSSYYIYNLEKEEKLKAVNLFKANVHIIWYSKKLIHRLLLPIYDLFGVNIYLSIINKLFKIRGLLDRKKRI